MTDYAQQAYWAAFAVTPDTLNLAAGFYPWSNPVWTVQDLPNNEKEVKACLETILEKAKEVQRPPRIICESAWIFHRLLERYAGELGIPLCLVTPNRLHMFASNEGKRLRPNEMDPALILRYAFANSPEATPYDAWRAKLRDTVGLCDQYLQDLEQYQTRLRMTAGELPVASMERQIANLEKEIEVLKQDCAEAIAQRESIDPRIKPLRDEGELDPYTIAVLMAYFDELGTLGRKKVACLLGVVPQSNQGRQAGDSNNRGGRVLVRRALYQVVANRIASHHPVTFRRYEALIDPNRANGPMNFRAASSALIHGLICHLESIAKHALAETGYIPSTARVAPKDA